MAGLKIRRIHLRGFQQFEDTVLDFTNPETGEVADRVCFIGRNGTGKSTILRLIDGALWKQDGFGLGNGRMSIEFDVSGRRFLLNMQGGVRAWHDVVLRRVDDDLRDVAVAQGATFATTGTQAPGAADLLVVQRVDVTSNQGPSTHGMPETRLNEALAYFTQFPVRHEISDAAISEMWRLLIFLVKKRQNDREEFERLEENLSRTKRELIEVFDAENASPLEAIGALWSAILGPAGLEFDAKNAKIPIQLTENLEAHIKQRETGLPIAYSALSTGIRNFLFRTGHLFLLYFNRKIERGFVLIDEPEDSLFPDFLFELTAVWEEILKGSRSQLFVATHSPLVAAQFEPWQRIVLEWDGHGHVTAHHGVAPRGDDPNDLLTKDFRLPHLMGEEGRNQLQKYLDLRRQLRSAREPEKERLVSEALEIAGKYGFGGQKA